MKKKAHKGEFAIDRELNIHTCGIEEWDRTVIHYHRSEPTPYRALDRFLEVYLALQDPFLVDFGAGRGRINFYFHHKMHVPGYGLELHPERLREALENRLNYARRKGMDPDELNIDFLACKAEEHLPVPESNMFFFFHPFADAVFEQALENIVHSLRQHDRIADLILYYPSYGYFRAIEQCGMFREFQFVDMDWNDDARDGFWVFRHFVEVL